MQCNEYNPTGAIDAGFTVSSRVERARLPATRERKVPLQRCSSVLARNLSKRTRRVGPSLFNIQIHVTLVGHDAALAGVSCGGHRKDMMAGNQVGSSIWRDIAGLRVSLREVSRGI